MIKSEVIRILIVDDDESILSVLERFFSLKEGVKVMVEKNPLKAIEKVEKEKVHIMLLDIQMPEMDGIEVLRRVKAKDPLVQVIMITAYSTIERVIRAFEYGASDFVLKPFKSLDYLWSIVEISILKIKRWKGILKETVEKKGGLIDE